MIKFFRRNQQIFILFIFLYCLVSIFAVYYTQEKTQYGFVPFRQPFLSGIYQNAISEGFNQFFFTSLICLTLLFSGFYLVRIGINYLIISKRSQFSALFYIAISAFCLRFEFYNGANIAAVFLLLALDRVIGSIDKRGRSYRFLDAGLILGLGSFFYFNLIFLLPFLWVAQLLLRPRSWRELLYPLLGLVFPVIYLFASMFLFNKSITELLSFLWEWTLLQKTITQDWLYLAGLGFYLLMMIIASFFALKKFAATKIQSRKLYQLLFFLFINLVIIVLIIPSAGIEILYLMAIPSAVLLSIYFTDCKNSLLNRLIFLLLIAAPIVINLL